MLALGRALMSSPRLLMLDEPSLGLAPLMVQEILAIVRGLRDDGVSILLVEQNARAALESSDHGYVLETGEVALSGASQRARQRPARAGHLPRRRRPMTIEPLAAARSARCRRCCGAQAQRVRRPAVPVASPAQPGRTATWPRAPRRGAPARCAPRACSAATASR